MVEEFVTDASASKPQRWKLHNEQVKALTYGEKDIVANLANTAAALKQSFGFFWVGFYLVKTNEDSDEEELVLGPFQGSVACTRIQRKKGVCGHCWDTATTVIVPDVDKFPGHIACSNASRSEIVVPVVKDGRVIIVIDVDSDRLNDFDDYDKNGLEALASIIAEW